MLINKTIQCIFQKNTEKPLKISLGANAHIHPMKRQTIIAIDPDVDKSGVCQIINDKKNMKITQLHLWELFDFLKSESIQECNLTVVIEAGWIDKSGREAKNKSYHGGGKGSSYDVGRNAEIGRQIEKFCIHSKINYKLVQPKGYSGINQKMFEAITGIKQKLNPEKRVSVLFALDEFEIQRLLTKHNIKK